MSHKGFIMGFDDLSICNLKYRILDKLHNMLGMKSSFFYLSFISVFRVNRP